MSPIPEVIMAEILDGVTADEDGKTYDSHALKPIRMLCAELTALRMVAEAAETFCRADGRDDPPAKYATLKQALEAAGYKPTRMH